VTFELPDRGGGDCVFCGIVAGENPARWERRPGGGAPGDHGTVVCFHNQLKWARVMLLVIPSLHMTQREFWSSQVLLDAASLAVEMGDRHCGDEGYRVISNFGRVAHQSQVHAHLHVVSGTSRLIGEAVLTSQGEARIPSTPGSDGVPLPGEPGNHGFVIDEYDVDETPFAVEISPVASLAQRELWASDRILEASRVALRISEQHSPRGFRLISSFDPGGEGAGTGTSMADSSPPGSNDAGLFLFGGGQLGLYI
jgi:diadenosine tetraphosphate (Ap4A) HIT family hydrolase